MAPVVDANGDEALPGLTYTAATVTGSRTTLGKLGNNLVDSMTGTTEAGIWELTYTVTDDNGYHHWHRLHRATMRTARASPSQFRWWTDVDLALDSVRKGDLGSMTFNRVTGGTVGEVAVGEVAGMAFALPAINSNKGGNGDP